MDALAKNPMMDELFFRQADGSEISGRQALANMAQEHAEMGRIADAHEVAAACFISSGA
ncbi:hypothetical protein [Dyella sp. Tek66A03]|uniref:hypothetical protein n=1 Tax=Dyella sp. Tek66A03 TaxID=3458298 RepID=UPI00403E9E68